MRELNDPMEQAWLNMWNERYRRPEYAFGEAPNAYLRQQLAGLEPGSILVPADGEGRNGVYAATLGWKVTAFDISEEGRKKALRLAAKHGVAIDYHVGGLESVELADGSYDAVALIYAHFPPAIRPDYHRAFHRALRPGGTVILEGFGQRHAAYQERYPGIGGPREPDLLLSVGEVRAAFPGYEVLELAEVEADLAEGIGHVGRGSVVRFTGRKP